MKDRVYKPTGTPGNSGDRFNLKCWKCGVWYEASCHWYTVFDKDRYTLRDKDWEAIDEEVVAIFPRIKVENIEAHECKRGGGQYGV